MEKLSCSRKNEIATGIFYVAFTIEILVMCIDKLGIGYGRLLQIAALLFGIKILLTELSLKEWIITILLGSVGFCVYFSSHSTLLIEIVLMIAASKTIRKETALKWFLGITLTAFLLMIALSLTGLIGNLSLTLNYRDNGSETRYCFGYNHPNVFYSNFFTVLVIGVLAFYDKMNGICYVMLTGINIIFYIFADSRTGFLVVQMAIILFYCLYRCPRFPEKTWIFWGSIAGLLGIIVTSYFLPYISYERTIYLDKLLTGRIRLATLWIENNQWSLLPNNQTPEIVLDMGYVHVMANWGILAGMIYLCTILYCYFKFYKVKNWPYVIALLVYSVFTFSEAHAFSIYFVGNIMFLLMIGWGTYESDKPEKQNT